MTQEQKRGQLRVYACGGAGMNIGHLLEEHRGHPGPAMADINVTYLDTSDSNLRPDTPMDHVYFIDGINGSGKVRSENAEKIKQSVKDAFQKHPPMDVNVVLHAGGGGSGSVFGPYVVSQLLALDKPVVVLVIGSAVTRTDAQNTLNVIKSYEGISNARKAPVVFLYEQNSREKSRADVDQLMRGTIVSIALLWSQQNRELDTKDLSNFLRFDRIPGIGFGPGLVHMTITGSEGNQDKTYGETISVATLALNGQDTIIDPPPPVQFVGYMADDAPDPIKSKMVTHFILTNGIVNDVSNKLKKVLGVIDAEAEARNDRTKESVLDDTDQPDEAGVVL